MRWDRAGGYEIVAGTHVVPEEGATVERYDLDDEDLLEAAIELASVDESRELSDLLDWCERWGLPGLLRERTLEVRLWPRWRADDEGAVARQRVYEGHREERTLPVEVQHLTDEDGTLVSDDFRASDRQPGDPLTEEELERFAQDRPEEGDAYVQRVHRDGFREPHTLTVDRYGHIQRQRLTEYVRYFPRVPGVTDLVANTATYRPKDGQWPGVGGDPTWPDWNVYLGTRELEELKTRLEREEVPLPSDADFWEEYGVPLQDIFRFARRLAADSAAWDAGAKKPLRPPQELADMAEEVENTLEGVVSPAKRRRRRREVRPKQQTVSRESQRHGTHHRSLRAISGFRPHVEFRDGEWQLNLQPSSLFAGLYMAIVRDATGAKRVGRCAAEDCDGFFVDKKKGRTRKYCSTTCSARARKRRQRSDTA